MRWNGQEVCIAGEMSLLAFLKEQNYPLDRIAVECNGRIIPKHQYHQYLLQPQDVLEVVSFVGGG